MARLPVVIVSGFLGAGKTTLVNHIFRHADGKRFVVFVNDFSDVNIDHALVDTVETNRISLKNGCVCCSLNDDLAAGIANLARQVRPPDCVLVEASGVADPRPLNASLALLEQAGHARLDITACVLDASGFGQLDYADGESLIDRAAACDLVIINKVDLVARESLDELRDTLKVAAPYSHTVEASYCAIDPAMFVDTAMRGASRQKFPELSQSNDERTHATAYAHATVEAKQLVDRARFNRLASRLPALCIRAKGILYFADRPRVPHLFNLVGHRASLEAIVTGCAPASTTFVAIGKAEVFQAEVIRQQFIDTLVRRPEQGGQQHRGVSNTP